MLALRGGLLAGLLLLLAASASAQGADSLTVRDALAVVESGHPMVRASEALAASREAAAAGVTPWAAPSLAYAMEGVGASGGFEQRLVAGVEVGPAALARAERQRLAAEARAFAFDAEAARRVLRARVVATYVALGVADSMVALQDEAVALADALVDVARRREAAGEAAGLETLRAELEAEQARATRAAAVARREAARAAASASVGLVEGAAAVAPRLMIPESVSSLLADADAMPPTLAAAAARVEAAQASAEAARAARRPVWTGEVFPQHFGGNTVGVGFQVGVRLPLFQRRALAARSASAESQRLAAEAERDALVRARAATVAAAEARVRGALDALEAARSGPAARAEALLTLALRGYELGEVTQPALLDTRRAALDARQLGLDAFRDVLLAVVAWERATGMPRLFTP